MSIVAPKKKIQAGDCVIMFGSKDNAAAISIKAGAVYNCRFGAFHHNDLIDIEYGSKVYSKNKSGYLHVLPVTSELWTNYLRHRTQILYSVDIAMVVYKLELKPGSIVVESGTGSGSLTSSLARTVNPTGHVFTFEFHAQRAAAAREDFQMTGLSSAVTVTNRDACKEGFLLEEKGLNPGTADGCFLDLPSPWEAIPHAEKVLKSGGMLCSFSPCIEQVQKAVEAMGTRFIDITTIECLLRPYDIRNYEVEHYNLNDVVDTLQQNPSKRQKVESTTSEEVKDEEKEKEKENEDEDKEDDGNGGEGASDNKNKNQNNNNNNNNNNSNPQTTSVTREFKQQRKSVVKTLLIKPITDIRGHTGYLTFARKV